MATIKQEKLAIKYAENLRSHNPKGVTELMRESGYSETTARTHQKIVTESKNFIELLNKYGASDKRIATVLGQGLSAKNGKKIDHTVRARFAELTMRAKGLLKESGSSELTSLANFLDNMKDFNFEVLIAIKQKITNIEPIDVTPNNG